MRIPNDLAHLLLLTVVSMHGVQGQGVNNTESPIPSPVKYCIGTGDFSLSGEGSYTVNVRYGYISCFGAKFSYNDSYAIASGPFFCEGNSSFVLNGSGLLYTVTSDEYNNCTNLIDSISYIHGNATVQTSCIGNGTYAFLGNGIFALVVNTSLPNSGLACLGTTNEISFSNGTAFIQTFGPFGCISSGYLTINGTGVIEDDDIYCAVTPITRIWGPLECSGTGEFKIIGSGFFEIVAIPEIECAGDGESFAYDIGTIFISRGNFTCNGSLFFNLNGTGEIESVTTVRGNHNCFDDTGMPGGSGGSGVINVLTCTGEGDYVIVGDGNFYINRTGAGMLQCSKEVISVLNASQKAEYITNGEFNCTVSGIVYFTGIGRAEIINASASYECNGVFFPGPTVEPPFSGFGDEINCYTCGDYFIVGDGQIEIVAQSSSSLNCQGAVSNQNVAQNVFVTTGDFFCTGNGFVHMTGRGGVLVNSTVFNNCTRNDTVTSDGLSVCSSFGDSSSNVGIIAGSVVGGVTIAISIVLILFIIICWRRKNAKKNNYNKLSSDGTLDISTSSVNNPLGTNHQLGKPEFSQQPEVFHMTSDIGNKKPSDPYNSLESRPQEKTETEHQQTMEYAVIESGGTDAQHQPMEYAVVDKSKKKNREKDKQPDLLLTVDTDQEPSDVPTVTASDSENQNKNNPLLHYAELDTLPASNIFITEDNTPYTLDS